MPAIMKTVRATVRALVPDSGTDATDPPGTFEALVSVFDNEDAHGDIVAPGAFANTIKKWADSEDLLAVMWSHQFGDVDSILGHYSTAEETDEGLKLKGHLDLSHPRAARIYALMKQRIVTEFSWSGEVLEYEVIEPEDPDDEFAWWFMGIKILEVDLWEAGPCFKGANPETQLISVKAADLTGPLAERIRRQGKDFTSDDLAKVATATGRKSAEPAVEPDPDEDPAPAAEDSDPTDESAEDDTATDSTTDVHRASDATKARALLELIDIH